jgi:VWFA-related protein
MLRVMMFAVAVSVVGAGPAATDVLPEARTELVRLDAVVNDDHGAPVRDLKQGDFVLLEDGKQQTITHFWSGGRKAVTLDAGAVTERPAAGTPAAAPGRDLLIVIDDLHISASGIDQTKGALKRVLDEVLAPNDLVAVASTSPYGSTLNFTLDRERVRAVIDSMTTQQGSTSMARGAQMTAAEAELILSGDRSALELVGRNLLAEPGSGLDNTGPQAATQARNGLVGAVGGPNDSDEGTQRLAEDQARRQARGVLDEALSYSVMSLRTIENAMRRLAELPGRKLCLVVSDGFLIGAGTSEERTLDLQRVVDAATRSGAVVYALDSRGLMSAAADVSQAGGASSPGLHVRVDRSAEEALRSTLTELADQTGGFVVRGTSDLAGGLRRMLEDDDIYYLLAYESTNRKRDGRFRKIEMRVAGHPGYNIRTRKGYLAPDDKKPARARALAPLLEADARALLDKPPTSGGAVRLDAFYVDLPPQGPQALLRAHVDLTHIAWEKIADHRRASVELVGGAYDASGHAVGASFSRPWDLDLDAAEYKRAATSGLRYQQALPLAPGRYQLRVLVRDGKGGVLGGGSEWVEIADLKEKKLTLSSVFLSPSTVAASAEHTAVPDAPDAPAHPRFKSGDNVWFELYVYNPVTDTEGRADVVLQAQIRAGDQVVAASEPQPVTFQEKDGLPVPQTNGVSLQGLAPGSYQLRVVVVDRKASATAFRNVDFTLD